MSDFESDDFTLIEEKEEQKDKSILDAIASQVSTPAMARQPKAAGAGAPERTSKSKGYDWNKDKKQKKTSDVPPVTPKTIMTDKDNKTGPSPNGKMEIMDMATAKSAIETILNKAIKSCSVQEEKLYRMDIDKVVRHTEQSAQLQIISFSKEVCQALADIVHTLRKGDEKSGGSTIEVGRDESKGDSSTKKSTARLVDRSRDESHMIKIIQGWTLNSDAHEFTTSSYVMTFELTCMFLLSLTGMSVEEAQCYDSWLRDARSIPPQHVLQRAKRVMNAVYDVIIKDWQKDDRYKPFLRSLNSKLISATGQKVVKLTTKLHLLFSMLQSHGRSDSSSSQDLHKSISYLWAFKHKDTDLMKLKDQVIPNLRQAVTTMTNMLGRVAASKMVKSYFGTTKESLPNRYHLNALRATLNDESAKKDTNFEPEKLIQRIEDTIKRDMVYGGGKLASKPQALNAEEKYYANEDRRGQEMMEQMREMMAMMVAHQNGKNRSRDAQWPKLGGNKQQKRQIPPVTKRQIPPVSVTESSAPPQKRKLRIPKDFPKGICFRFCLGICNRPTEGPRKCYRKHLQTPETIKIVEEYDFDENE